MEIKRTYRFRFYPQPEQEVILARTFGCARFAYNQRDALLSIRWSRTLPKAAKLTTATVSRDAAGRYFVSLLCDDVVAAKPAVEGKIGIDLGLTHFAILSTGEKIAAPNTYRKHEARLGVLQRRL